MADNSNSITRLAIHIYSIIATKHNFSDFGNIQTKKCSLLKIEKVHKTNVLWMDISRCHAELGLTEPWGKRKLGASEGANCVTEAVPSDFDDNDNNKFGSLASRLINAATDANTVINNIADMADAPISSTDSQPCHHRPTHTQIRLKDLFDYQNSNNYLDFYHTAAKKNLQIETETFEQMFAEQEGNKTVVIPTVTPCTPSSIN